MVTTRCDINKPNHADSCEYQVKVKQLVGHHQDDLVPSDGCA